jgi:hypothetical protein
VLRAEERHSLGQYVDKFLQMDKKDEDHCLRVLSLFVGDE